MQQETPGLQEREVGGESCPEKEVCGSLTLSGKEEGSKDSSEAVEWSRRDAAALSKLVVVSDAGLGCVGSLSLGMALQLEG